MNAGQRARWRVRPIDGGFWVAWAPDCDDYLDVENCAHASDDFTTQDAAMSYAADQAWCAYTAWLIGETSEPCS